MNTIAGKLLKMRAYALGAILVLIAVDTVWAIDGQLKDDIAAALQDYDCVERVKYYDRLCPQDQPHCLAKTNFIIVVEASISLASCLDQLIGEFPMLKFVRKYPIHKWIIATPAL